MSELYYLDWILMILNLYSYFLIGNKNKLGFLLGIFGCFIGLILFTILIFNFPMLIMYCAFGTLNAINYIKWNTK